MNFVKNLLDWYSQNKRDLPWRKTSDPYKIWVSEIMLQQTQVNTVIDYYLKFIKKYPSFKTLAQAEEQEILNLWQGLGYYSRAQRLIPCAKKILHEFNGQFPKEYKEALTLPGVGPYTAGAVLSIAYNKKIPAIDGNVKRVYARLYNLHWDISTYSSKKKFNSLVQKTLPDNSREFNQALMELGALICKPKNPLCDKCPIQKQCKAYAENNQVYLPINNNNINKTIENFAVLILKHEDKIFIKKRPSSGLLSNMWGFITIEDLSVDKIKIHIQKQYNLEVTSIEMIQKTKHTFTHKLWQMKVYLIKIKTIKPINNGQWVIQKDLKKYPIPTAFNKLIQWIK